LKETITREKDGRKYGKKNKKNCIKSEIRTVRRENIDKHVPKNWVNGKRNKTDNFCKCHQRSFPNQKF
jgi:hypothetical protein